LGWVIDRFLFRNIAGTSQATKVVVTMALLIMLQGTAVAVFGAQPKAFDPFLPTSTFSLGAVNVGWDQLIVVVLGVVVLVALTVFFRFSRTGTAMRGAVDDPDLIRSAGFDAGRLGGLTWALGSATAGLAGILLSPLLGLDSVILTLLVVQAYAAAILGRLTSLVGAFVGAIVLGLSGSLALKAFAGTPWLLNGLRPSIPFLFLFAALVLGRREPVPAAGAGSSSSRRSCSCSPSPASSRSGSPS
jgi:branched-chain amino acid transport system permease protein